MNTTETQKQETQNKMNVNVISIFKDEISIDSIVSILSIMKLYNIDLWINDKSEIDNIPTYISKSSKVTLNFVSDDLLDSYKPINRINDIERYVDIVKGKLLDKTNGWILSDSIILLKELPNKNNSEFLSASELSWLGSKPKKINTSVMFIGDEFNSNEIGVISDLNDSLSSNYKYRLNDSVDDIFILYPTFEPGDFLVLSNKHCDVEIDFSDITTLYSSYGIDTKNLYPIVDANKDSLVGFIRDILILNNEVPSYETILNMFKSLNSGLYEYVYSQKQINPDYHTNKFNYLYNTETPF